MKLANLEGRATLVTDDGIVDIHDSSDGLLPCDPDRAVENLAEVGRWYRQERPDLDPSHTAFSLAADPVLLGPPVARPSQIFAIGLNYAAHAAETNRRLPTTPLVFTKFASALAGPGDTIALPTQTCDWEVELVVVMGRTGRHIPLENALEHVAGYCVGQDISERSSQTAGERPQFSMAKSHRGFAPIGPWLTTLDELADPEDLVIEASIGDENVQAGRTSDMIFGVSALVSHLSQICELRVGDLIFTGTPPGVGQSRTPPRFLVPGDLLCSQIHGLGGLRNRIVDGCPRDRN
ncbi:MULTISPECIES: fumarylacetoacetate hydrolase family protein [Nocardia]|uniref:fumarylacetoacetate hydrolase family protein n=1 Tax=Nocardia TaxID=1817 RepID=UPI002454525E|nr:fumarylacetoacetate hydrolase family protein [Nocardia neocaledoniensis]